MSEDNIVNTSGGRFVSGTALRAVIEHLRNVSTRYMTGDLDKFSRQEIDSSIRTLENLQNTYGDDDDLFVLLGLVSNIISSLYVARGYATHDVPRSREYYQSMNDIRRLFRQIERLR